MILHIAEMLRTQKKGHISFHTPGHKKAGEDITELSYSDNLFSPRGVLGAAERDIAEILGANKSFILTDGSTCGVFSMIWCVKAAGGKKLAVPVFSHPSVFHACEVMGVEIVPIPQKTAYGIPVQPSAKDMAKALDKADALLLTSPDYYGFLANLKDARELCGKQRKPLLIDGAHGGHLHFCEPHAGKFADLWVDGVHKSLPANTQGAVVSAKNENWGVFLQDAVKKFRTTSPSYPIMASVEYAVKYPRNEKIEEAAIAFKARHGCANNDDWTKILIPFGENCGKAQAYLEEHGVYPEFNDGNYLLFYLSPCTKETELKTLEAILENLLRGEVKKDAPCGEIPMYGED